MTNAGIVPSARTISAERHGCAFASSIRSLSRSYAAASSSSSATIFSRPCALLDLHPGRRGERVAWVEGSQLDELAGVYIERPQDGGAPVDRHVAAHPDRMAPGAHDVARPAHRRRQPAEALLPLVAPDLEVDVHDVVVAGRETRDPVVDDERPLREPVRGEPPDDPRASAEVLDAERARRAAGLQLGRSPRLERPTVLRDADLVDALAVPQRDLAEAVRERAGEGNGDRLVDGDRAVGADVRLDVARDELIGLAVGDPGERERGGGCRREDAEPTCHRVRRPRRARRAEPGARERQAPPERRSGRSRPAAPRAASRRSRRTRASRS